MIVLHVYYSKQITPLHATAWGLWVQRIKTLVALFWMTKYVNIINQSISHSLSLLFSIIGPSSPQVVKRTNAQVIFVSVSFSHFVEVHLTPLFFCEPSKNSFESDHGEKILVIHWMYTSWGIFCVWRSKRF